MQTIYNIQHLVINLCCPCRRPDGRIKVVFDKPTLTELTTKPELPNMPVQDASVTISGDAPFGYELSGIAFVNKAGNPADPAPNTVVVTTSDATVCGASYLGGGRLWLQPLDSAAAGATCDLTISANETGTDDDAHVHVTIGEDRIGAVDVGNVAVVELTAPPA